MNIINTRNKLQEYILMKLGSPIHNVELSQDQINLNIDDAIKEFTEVAMEGQENKILILDIEKGVNEYILDGRVKTIQRLSMSSNTGISAVSVGGVFMTSTELFANSVVNFGGTGQSMGTHLSQLVTALSNISLYNNLFNVQVNYRWNEYTKRLTFYEDVSSKGDKCLLECSVSYIPQEVDYIYDNVWVKEFATALCKKNWGENIGKYDSTLINGSKIDYVRILTEANAEIDRLRQELSEKWQEPFGVIVG